jgi:hypothetical protein
MIVDTFQTKGSLLEKKQSIKVFIIFVLGKLPFSTSTKSTVSMYTIIEAVASGKNNKSQIMTP